MVREEEQEIKEREKEREEDIKDIKKAVHQSVEIGAPQIYCGDAHAYGSFSYFELKLAIYAIIYLNYIHLIWSLGLYQLN